MNRWPGLNRDTWPRSMSRVTTNPNNLGAIRSKFQHWCCSKPMDSWMQWLGWSYILFVTLWIIYINIYICSCFYLFQCVHTYPHHISLNSHYIHHKKGQRPGFWDVKMPAWPFVRCELEKVWPSQARVSPGVTGVFFGMNIQQHMIQ